MPTKPPEPHRAPALALDPAVPGTHRFCVGFSGGLDSTVLLHRLLHAPGLAVRALHVHHGLQGDADAWAAHCADVCAAWGVAFQLERVGVVAAGDGPEAAARRARHAAFARHLQPGEALALAHHRDDQAETFLLRALRASGPDGLAAMRPLRPFAAGVLWRPLLAHPRTDLLAYAQAHGLAWIEDPSNAAPDVDRSFLRHRVMPLLRQRWPQADAAFAQAAALAGDAHGLLVDVDAAALPALQDAAGTLGIAALQALPAAQRARMLRVWVRTRGLPPLPANGVRQLERLCHARHDGEGRYDWCDASAFAWRGRLHALPTPPALPHDLAIVWDGRAPLPLPTGDVLTWNGPAFDPPLHVRARRGGERIRLPGRGHSHALKQQLQALAMPPWQRQRLPLLLAADGRVLAAGDRLHADGWPTQGQLHWQLA